MIHRIKALHDGGNGLSIRAISEQLGVSRNTVRTYLRADEKQLSEQRAHRRRMQKLDQYREYLVHLLKRFPKLSSVKVARKLREKVGEVEVSNRTLRRYVRQLKSEITTAQVRYYEPVLDMVAGVQCQVDPGELREVRIGDEVRPVYFVVFVLSYSRMMYVGVSFKPLDTDCFIQMHDEAFRFFGGAPEECVYDQTKLVVIAEQFRELTLNQAFYAYATAAGFRIHACEGYDPESKGKVEAGVKYVKQDAFYGEEFTDEAHLRAFVQEWLATVANARRHGTTGEIVCQHFTQQEQSQLQPYGTPLLLQPVESLEVRKVDKTGLLSWRANRYTAPMIYQQGRVGVREAGGQLLIHDLESGELIAEHSLATGKGRVVRNTDHYRDHAKHLKDLEQQIGSRLGTELGSRLCARLKTTSPRIYKDQLRGALQVLEAQDRIDLALISQLADRDQLTVSQMKKHLEAHARAVQRGRDELEPLPAETLPKAALQAYAPLGRSNGHQEVTHGCA